ncbi:OLC1v1031510C1 [Oldenlandia corymbosa var. corymbosa]|uniref:OLC1v1031510C1 n=1 Tax=Oldenlandia corymbosa var. corymbosa TaxID=529605 RepID=A0AAV1CLI5_OLDCO|nr:OLC1v1031510C1 [Oldenlandia corymbosa var. corymbosa]
MAASTSMKKNYRCHQSLKQFYSGGPYAVSSDGSFIVCACDDTIKIVDSSNAAIKSSIEGDTEPVTALVLSPLKNNAFLFSASHSRQIRVWDLATLKCIRSWKGHEGPVMSMACHGSGGLLATAGSDGKVLVWDVDGGFCTHFFKGHKGVVNFVMFHPDPNRLLLFSGSDDTTIRIWDLTRKKCLATLEKHLSAVTSLAITEDGGTLLSSGRDKIVNLWSLHDFSCKVTVPTYEALEAVCAISSHSPFASCLASMMEERGKRFKDSNSIHFITVGERGMVRIWNSDGAVCLFEQKTSDVVVSSENDNAKRGFHSAIMLPSNQGLLCTADQQFFFYTPVVDPEGSFKIILSKRLIGYNEEITDMKFLGEEEQFLAVSSSVEHVRVYDLASMSCAYVLSGHLDVVLCLDTCVTDSGRTLIVTGSKDSRVRVWDAGTQCCIGVGKGVIDDQHGEAFGAVAFSRKQRNFFVSGSSLLTLKVWSLDGLADSAEDVPNLKSKRIVPKVHAKDINCLAIAPDDSLVCSGSQDRTACVRTLPDLDKVVELKGHKRGVWSVEFSPVDRIVITASGDKTIKIWAISDGSCLKTFEGHTSSVIRASFVTRGAQFVSCGADGLVKLWTVNTNECIATYDSHDDKIWALAIGKKTEMLATGGSDAVINLWHDSTSADKEEEFRKEEEDVLRGQELDNAIVDADYVKAIRIAFELRRPHKLFELFGDICRKRSAEDQIVKALNGLVKEELPQLIEYIREWNTKPKLCHVAHFVLFQIFNMLSPTEIVEIRGIRELLEGLIPYSQRHYSRIDRLQRSTFLLDYTLTGMSVIEPETVESDTKENNAKRSKDEENPTQAEGQENGALEEEMMASQKKRKSRKPKDVAYKKVKSPTTNTSIPSQAY